MDKHIYSNSRIIGNCPHFPKITVIWRIIVLAALLSLIQSGCSPQLIQVGSGKKLEYNSEIGKRVCFLPVILEYQSAGHFSRPVPAISMQEEFGESVEKYSREYIENCGFEVVEIKELPLESLKSAEKEFALLRTSQRDLFNPLRSKDSVKESLSQIGILTGAKEIILVNVQIRLGQSGGIDMITGYATANTNSVSIKAVALSSLDGHLFWSNEVFMRKPLDPELGKKAVKMLFCSK